MQRILELAYKLEAAKVNLSGFDIDRMLKEQYVEDYNLCNLNDKWKPLARVAVNPKEDYAEGDRLYERIFHYKTYEIAKIFEMSPAEFLSLPRHVVEHLLTIQREEFVRIQALKEKARKDAERDVQKGAGGQAMPLGPMINPPQA